MATTIISNSAWAKVLHGQNKLEFESLSLKILLAKSRLRLKREPDDFDKCINELNLLIKIQSNLPSLQRDIKKIIAHNESFVEGKLYSLDETISLIESGAFVTIAADEQLLKQLPQGNWIGGTIPYFMTTEGGLTSKEKLFINEIPSFIKEITIKEYTASTISTIYKDCPLNGFSIVIIPASSSVHFKFALEAPHFEDFATRPLIGWISGVLLSEINNLSPKIFCGTTQKSSDSKAVVMHISLPPEKYAELFIVNIFEQNNSDSISFPEDGFKIKDVLVNNVRMNFTDYLLQNNIDTRMPLVADYYGVSINISFQNIDTEKKEVTMYAPVLKNTKYKIAKPIDDFASAFESHIKNIDTQSIVFSCNCILNYLYGELEGKKTALITGPITFGEIAYQLLNQTMTYLKISSY